MVLDGLRAVARGLPARPVTAWIAAVVALVTLAGGTALGWAATGTAGSGRTTGTPVAARLALQAVPVPVALTAPVVSLPDRPGPSTAHAAAPARAAAAPGGSSRRDQLVTLANRKRAAAGVGRLTASAALARSAQQYAKKLAADGDFSHADGSQLSDRVRSAGFTYRVVGENLALGQRSPAAVIQDWMHSAGHRRNLLDADFTEVGAGVATRSDGQVVWCLDFGRPLT
jgi:uncharacterized protein YkwD